MQINGSYTPTIMVGKDKDGQPCAHIVCHDGNVTPQVYGKNRLRFVATTSFATGALTWQQLNKLQGEIANLRELPNVAPSFAKVEGCPCGSCDLMVFSTDGDAIGRARSKDEARKAVSAMLNCGLLEHRQESDALLAVINRSRLPEKGDTNAPKHGGPGEAFAESLLAMIFGAGLKPGSQDLCDGSRPKQPSRNGRSRVGSFVGDPEMDSASGFNDPFDDGLGG